MSRPIYGNRVNAIGDNCNCVPQIPPSMALSKLISILQILRTVIDNFYDPTTSVAPVVAEMNMSGVVNTPIFIRLRWVKLHVGEKFNKHSYRHVCDINGLKWIYDIMGRDWHEDPLFAQPDYVIPTDPNT